MTRIHPIELALALALAAAAHGAALVGLALRQPEPPAEAAEPLVYLELAALEPEPGPPDLAAPAAAPAPAMPDLPAEIAPDTLPPEPLPLQQPEKAVPPPEMSAPTLQPPPADLAPPEVEVVVMEPAPPPPERAAARIAAAPPTPVPPPPAERPEPAPPIVDLPRRPPERTAEPVSEPRTEVASAPAVVPPQAVAPARRQDGDKQAIAAYAGALYKLINTVAVRGYPRQSAKRGEQGVVPVRLTVGAGGELLSVKVVDETGASGRLVRAALQAVEKAAPFPAFAPTMASETETFEVSIVYKLQ